MTWSKYFEIVHSKSCASSIDSTLCFFPKDRRIYHITWILEDHHMTAETFAWAVHDLAGLFVFIEGHAVTNWLKSWFFERLRIIEIVVFSYLTFGIYPLITHTGNMYNSYQSINTRMREYFTLCKLSDALTLSLLYGKSDSIIKHFLGYFPLQTSLSTLPKAIMPHHLSGSSCYPSFMMTPGQLRLSFTIFHAFNPPSEPLTS